jgi:Protein of unknown function (DUF3443)
VYRILLFSIMLAAQVSSSKCDSSSSGSGSNSAPNVLPVVVNGGPTNSALNQLFASVTVCVPGTTNCQTIGGILVDTGSVGLRVLSSALTVPLPQQTGSGGAPVVECLPFVDGFTWGPVQTADVKMAGERASGIAIQVVGVDRFPTIPSDCSSQGTAEETLSDLNANGVLGVGLFREDCGLGCALTGSSNPGLYYVCPTPTGCVVTTEPVASQVQNPVSHFASDNNGVVIQLPAVPSGGAPSTSGTLTFGIGTQGNNALGSAKIFTLDNRANFATVFNGQTYSSSFIDSGSNGIFFLDSAGAGLPACKNSKGFYCPTTLTALSATQRGLSGTTTVVAFNAGNVDQVNSTFSVFAEATGANPGGFDWGLPFFFGRTVFVAIAGQSTPGGTGPYWAY